MGRGNVGVDMRITALMRKMPTMIPMATSRFFNSFRGGPKRSNSAERSARAVALESLSSCIRAENWHKIDWISYQSS